MYLQSFIINTPEMYESMKSFTCGSMKKKYHLNCATVGVLIEDPS